MASLVAQMGEANAIALDPFVDRTNTLPLTLAPDECFDLAETLLEDMSVDFAGAIDIEAILKRLGIRILRRPLDTNTIRGLAIADCGLIPALIIINTSSPFSRIDAGGRFTMAHELCHILYDQSSAQRVKQASGSWALSGIEKRATAFAAMVLMPRA